MTWAIGRDTFAYLHGFHWEDHQWSRSIPEIDRLETFEQIVHTERPELLRIGVGNVEQER
jgi:hypothetical protein